MVVLHITLLILSASSKRDYKYLNHDKIFNTNQIQIEVFLICFFFTQKTFAINKSQTKATFYTKYFYQSFTLDDGMDTYSSLWYKQCAAVKTNSSLINVPAHCHFISSSGP